MWFICMCYLIFRSSLQLSPRFFELRVPTDWKWIDFLLAQSEWFPFSTLGSAEMYFKSSS